MNSKVITISSILLLTLVGFPNLVKSADEEPADNSFDFFSLGSEYWNRMRMGLAFDVYDDAAFVAETVKKEENPDVKLNVVRKNIF